MKKLAVLFFAVLAAGFMFLVGGPSASAKAAPDEALIGVVNASDTTIYGLAGEKPVFLNFWATWCPPCVGEMPAIEEMYKKYGDRLHFAAVSVDDENGAAAAFVQSGRDSQLRPRRNGRSDYRRACRRHERGGIGSVFKESAVIRNHGNRIGRVAQGSRVSCQEIHKVKKNPMLVATATSHGVFVCYNRNHKSRARHDVRT